MKCIGVADQFVNLDWKVEAARDDGQPLCPCPLSPQAITFEEAQDGIGERDSPNHGEAGNRHFVGGMRQPAATNGAQG